MQKIQQMLRRTAAASPRGWACACAPTRAAARRPAMASARVRGAEGDVAIVGAGVAGLTCAQVLAHRGVPVTLYDAGGSVGGRASSRVDRGVGGVWDHGARFVELAPSEVDDGWSAWVKANAQQWQGDFASIETTASGMLIERRALGASRRFAVNASLSADAGVEVKSRARVVGLEKSSSDAFVVLYRGVGSGDEVVRDEGFKVVVLADRTLASERAAAIHGEEAPPVGGLEEPELAATLSGITSIPSLALMVALNRAPAVGFVGAEVLGHPVVGWISDESSKPNRSSEPKCWVAHSTEAFALARLSERELHTKVGTSSHQEWLNEVRDDMSDALLAILRAAERKSASPPSTPLEVTFKRAHRWGAAFPASMPPGAHPHGFLRSGNVFAIGDYCATPLGSIRAAVTSGRACADEVARRLSDAGHARI